MIIMRERDEDEMVGDDALECDGEKNELKDKQWLEEAIVDGDGGYNNICVGYMQDKKAMGGVIISPWLDHAMKRQNKMGKIKWSTGYFGRAGEREDLARLLGEIEEKTRRRKTDATC